MPDLEIAAGVDVTAARIIEQDTYPANEAILPGQYVRISGLNGRAVLANASDASDAQIGGVALTEAKQAGDAVTFVRYGLINLGFETLESLSFGAPVYLSDEPGTLSDEPGTVEVVVGAVVSGWANTDPDKLLRVFPFGGVAADGS